MKKGLPLLFTTLLVLIILVYLYYLYETKNYIDITDDLGITYNVLSNYNNYCEVFARLIELNNDIYKLMKHLRKVYVESEDKSTRNMKVIRAILVGYNPEVIYENDPLNESNSTSYVIDKGKSMYICLRDNKDPLKLIDHNTLLFVILHEISHIGNYDGWGHESDFWEVFSYVLSHAVNIGIYKPIDYYYKPVKYCSMIIDYSPIYKDGKLIIKS